MNATSRPPHVVRPRCLHPPIVFRPHRNRLGYVALLSGPRKRWAADARCPYTAALRLAWKVWFGFEAGQLPPAEWFNCTKVDRISAEQWRITWDPSRDTARRELVKDWPQ